MPSFRDSLQQLFLQFEAQGLEGLLSVNGRPYAGIDGYHSRVRVPQAGRLELSAEFACLLPALGPRVLSDPLLFLLAEPVIFGLARMVTPMRS